MEQTTGSPFETEAGDFLSQQDDLGLTIKRGVRTAGLQQTQPLGDVSHFIMPGQSAQACAPSGDTSIPSVMSNRRAIGLNRIVAANAAPR